ncbi:MAG: phenylalanine--tRNA ligase subunit alpha [Alphaproteobacteria bacterium]|jgi:phenylalanyl-tRNA synthetase alpha chain
MFNFKDIEGRVKGLTSVKELDLLKSEYFGKSSPLTAEFANLRHLNEEDKKERAKVLNKIKEDLNAIFDGAKTQLERLELEAKLQKESLDITLPTRNSLEGSLNPIPETINEVVRIMGNMGFKMADGYEIEDDAINFTALNIPENHPARQMHDTFYVENLHPNKTHVLRTHTSPVQIHALKAGKPPFRIIASGKTFRSDSDATHSPMFHQMECLCVDKNISFANLRYVLNRFIKDFFEVADIELRFRPSFFPFTEPSAEVDVGYSKQNGKIVIGGKNNSNFLEILGCGMVHPSVLENVGIDSKEYSGFAFGVGIERLAMLKYGIDDLRKFFENDERWLQHYNFA